MAGRKHISKSNSFSVKFEVLNRHPVDGKPVPPGVLEIHLGWIFGIPYAEFFEAWLLRVRCTS